VLLKGGHLQGDVVEDLLLQADGTVTRLASPRIATRNGHGTGCTLSSAIAAHLAQGLGLADAVRAARTYILGAIEAGADVITGSGHGPLNHGWGPRVMQVIDAG
jgi:hydroxymethylpyrimidine/phosphomethylpyrimidine kinase